ncbi:conserved hypothetical protein [Flavobacterium sp. 9AF]|uniref:DUF6402 family protein n=1 Tax=Flavobacterium sp. 9AF TaxID=2653142 RepID=UPI0012EFB34F|nr:DUF6402 family protein [Flavobacterium sp. 9AF]VXC01621.1 conserved hypothetical protein [Flavobacterium sp. 9AF]
MVLLNFENDNVSVTFKVDPKIQENEYKIKTYARNGITNGTKTLIATSESFALNKNDENVQNFTIDYVFYNKAAKKINNNKALPNVIVFTFSILIGKNENESQGDCKVHFVRYIPKLLNIKGWINAEKLQKIWFTKGNNADKKKVFPELNAITWQWITSESREVNEEYLEFLNDNKNQLNAMSLIRNNNVQNALKNEINKMVTAGLAEIPTAIKPKIIFGVQSNQVVNHNNEKMPLFEKYYYNSKSFSGIWDLGKHYLREGIDDFIAAIANFNFHVFATGSLEYVEGGYITSEHIKVNVTKLHFYIKDSFDFVDDDPNASSQPLGYWKISDDGSSVEVEKDSPSNANEYFEVTNKSYRDYRDDHRMGYDFYLYSTLNEVNVNLSFNL